MNPLIAVAAALLVACGILGYRVHTLEQQVGAAVPKCNTEKLQADFDAQTIALAAAEKAVVDMREQSKQTEAEATAARESQQHADTERATLAQRLSELNHVQAQLPSCREWLSAPVPCDFGM